MRALPAGPEPADALEYMDKLVNYFAEALRHIDRSGIPFKNYKPGVGPYAETQLVIKSLQYLKEHYIDYFAGAKTKRHPDLLIPEKWALEFKIVRPFGDNGKPAEHWSENMMHPYAGNVSVLGDCISLLNSDFSERKGVVVFTYEHSEPRFDLSILFDSFELIASEELEIRLSEKFSKTVTDLIHPVHQQATVYGWEILE